jgi:hypothetical protein
MVKVPKKSNKGIVAQQYNLRGRLKNEELLAILQRHQYTPKAQPDVLQAEEGRNKQGSVRTGNQAIKSLSSVRNSAASEPQALIQYIDALLKRTEDPTQTSASADQDKGQHSQQHDKRLVALDTSEKDKTAGPVNAKLPAKQGHQEIVLKAGSGRPKAQNERSSTSPPVQRAAELKQRLPSTQISSVASQVKQRPNVQSIQKERSVPPTTEDQQLSRTKAPRVTAVHPNTTHAVIPQQRGQSRSSSKFQDRQALYEGLQILGAGLAPQQGSVPMAAGSTGQAVPAASFPTKGHSSITILPSARVTSRLSKSGAASVLNGVAGGSSRAVQQVSSPGGKTVPHTVQRQLDEQQQHQGVGTLGSEASELIRVLHSNTEGAWYPADRVP